MSAFPDGGSASEQPKWRRDFPIDWAEDQLVSRRDLLRYTVVISAGFTVGQFWIGWLSMTDKREDFPRTPVARIDDLEVGGSLVFSYPKVEDRCLLVRRGEREFVAFSQKCTHLACAVVPEPEHDRIHCPCHAGYFDLKSGRPIAGPPRRPLPQVVLELEGDQVYAVAMKQETV